MRVIAIPTEKFRMWVFTTILFCGLINVSAQKTIRLFGDLDDGF